MLLGNQKGIGKTEDHLTVINLNFSFLFKTLQNSVPNVKLHKKIKFRYEQFLCIFYAESIKNIIIEIQIDNRNQIYFSLNTNM